MQQNEINVTLPNALLLFPYWLVVTKWMTFALLNYLVLLQTDNFFFILWIFAGARMLYKNLPRAVGLRRITLHKTMNLKQEMVYFLLVECSHFMDHINEAANLLPILRARICGYTGIFRCVESFWSPQKNYQIKSSKSCLKRLNAILKIIIHLTRTKTINECKI